MTRTTILSIVLAIVQLQGACGDEARLLSDGFPDLPEPADTRRFVFGIEVPGEFMPQGDQWYSKLHKAGVHHKVMVKYPEAMHDLDFIADSHRAARLRFARMEDKRDYFPECRWIVKIWSVEKVDEELHYDVTASLGEASEIACQSSNIVNHDFITHERWLKQADGNPPLLIKRETQFSLKQRHAPHEPLPRTIAQLKDQYLRALTAGPIEGSNETALQRLNRMCGSRIDDSWKTE